MPGIEKQKKVEENVRFILSHFNNQNYNYPKSIKTLKSNGDPICVYNEKEIVYHFLESNFIDCKINGYPIYDKKSYKSIYPNFIFIDLDLSLCKICKYPERKLDYLLKESLKKIEKEIHGFPTVLWTGDGYHIYQPIKLDNGVFDKEKQETTNPSNCNFEREYLQQYNKSYNRRINDFLRFSVKFLTNNQKDFDYSNISTDSCFTITPESINSKKDTKIKLIQKWNGHRANATTILRLFSSLYDKVV